MTSISKNAYIDKLDDVVNKYNSAYHSTFKMRPVDVKSKTYINSSKEIGDIIKIPKYKNIFPKGYVRNCSEEVFVIKKVKSTVSWTCVISDLKGEEIVGTFYKKELQKANQKDFRVEKVIKRKNDKL